MKRILTLFVGIALMLPGTALAQGSSTCQSYNPQLCSVNTNATTPSAQNTQSAQNRQNAQNTQNAQSPQSALPFTGLDVVLLAAGGGALLGAGLVVRRLSRDLE